jgi:hypothetical protein
MFTRGPTHRAVRRSAPGPRRAQNSALYPPLRHSIPERVARSGWLGLAGCLAAGLSSGCLQALGEVEIVGGDPALGTHRVILGEVPADCVDAGVGPCAEGRCVPDQLRCDGDLLEVCDSSGKKWALIEQCASVGLCDASAGVCRAAVCDVREHQCTETGELLVCNTERTGFEHVAQCSSPAFCNAVRGQERCEEAICDAGARRCNGAQLEACRQDQMGYSPVQPACTSAALCRTDGPGQAHCDPPTCTAGQYACDARELRLCNENSNGWIVLDRCTSAPLCNLAAKRCDPVACQLGEQQCQGSVLRRCNADQTGFSPVVDCGDPLLCDTRVMTCLTMPAPTPAPPAPTPSPVPPPVTLPPVPPEVANGAAYTFIDAPKPLALGLQLSQLNVPREWTQVDQSPWLDSRGATLGPRLVISTDTARFISNFDIPGVLFAASALAPVDVASRLAQFDLSAHCTKGVADTYTDQLYTGPRQTWINCGAGAARTTVIAATPLENPSFVAVVLVTALATRDETARQNAWDSFLVTAQ